MIIEIESKPGNGLEAIPNKEQMGCISEVVEIMKIAIQTSTNYTIQVTIGITIAKCNCLQARKPDLYNNATKIKLPFLFLAVHDTFKTPCTMQFMPFIMHFQLLILWQILIT